jgi:hypothetical protein
LLLDGAALLDPELLLDGEPLLEGALLLPDGELLVPDGLLAPDDELPGVVLGEAAGLLPDDPADVLLSTPSFAMVSASSRPVALRPCFCW